MKKTLFISALALLSLASCIKDDKLETSEKLQQLNLVFDKNGQLPASICKADYDIKLNQTDNLIDMNVTNLAVGDKTISFSFLNQKYTGNSTELQFSIPEIAGANSKISDFKGLLTLAANAMMNSVYVNNSRLIANYEVDQKWEVRTFPMRALYKGIGKFSVSGKEPFNNNDVLFGVNIDPQTMTATVEVYNFQGAANMPVKVNFSLSGLTVKPENGKYSIVGQNIVPVMIPEGTPAENFKFKNFELETESDDLTDIEIEFQMASMPFFGEFEGSYLNKSK